MDRRSAKLLTILGPTAAGKTEYAARLALQMDGEIISADSRQVYRGMDIGTGKDYADYQVDGRSVPYHLIDILDAGYEYNVYLFKRDFLRVFHDISDREKLPVMCGGTGLYIESILRNYRLLNVPVNQELRADLEGKSYEELEGMLKLYGPLHNQTDTVNRKRLVRAIEIAMYHSTRPEPDGEEASLNSLVLGIDLDRMLRRRRITARLKKRLDEGLVEEVEGLLEQGISYEKMEYYGLEYRFVSRYIKKELTYDDMFRRLNTAIHQFAKRQMTYFRGMERRGIPIHWIDGTLPMEDKVASGLAVCRTAFDEQ
jgi:tRNA dimethylallyltransferase